MIDQEPRKSPITILVDTAESNPFTFEGIRGDAKDEYRPLAIARRYQSLGRHPHSLGDYSAVGLVGHAHVERKSVEDAQSTVLGWTTPGESERDIAGRRKRFEQEIENFAKIPAGVIVVEGTLGECLRTMPEWGTKPAQTNAKIFNRSVIAYQQDYRVPWFFCDSRRLAEIFTYRWLARAHRKLKEAGRLKGR